jgi:hypothetical protein
MPPGINDWVTTLSPSSVTGGSGGDGGRGAVTVGATGAGVLSDEPPHALSKAPEMIRHNGLSRKVRRIIVMVATWNVCEKSLLHDKYRHANECVHSENGKS